MRLVKNVTLSSRTLPIQIALPDFTDRFLIPSKITLNSVVSQGEKVVRTPVKDIVCKVTGSAELFFLKESYFQYSHIIDLSDKHSLLSDGHSIKLLLQRSTQEASPVTVEIDVEYTSTEGVIIFQNTYDTFEKVMEDIFDAGRCTKLMLSFNRPLKGTQMTPSFEVRDSENEWITGLELGDTNEDKSYVIDFTDPELVQYPRYLNYLNLKVDYNNDTEPLKLYVLAYGFITK